MTTTSSSITLAGGRIVDFQFEDGVGTGSADTLVSLGIKEPSGAVVLPLEPLDSGIPEPRIQDGIVLRIDSYSAAPLADGSFAYIGVHHLSQSGAATSDFEALSIVHVDADGHEVGFGGVAIGIDLPVTGISTPDPDFTTPPTILPLSGSHFAVFYDGVNGSTSFKGLALLLDDHAGASNILLQGAPDQVIRDGVADLQLSWANGDQVLVGGPTHQSLQGGSGDDTLVSGGGADTLFGGDGADSIAGGPDFDRTNGNVGNDTVHGNDGNDWVTGGKDSDVLFGDFGDDILNGNLGNDTADGGPGADTVRGGQGDDMLVGGSGDDFISGDLGDDTMTGGAGADTFRAFNGGGSDRITDFNAAEGDHVQLDHGTTFAVAQVGDDTVIDLFGGDQIVLVGVTLTDLFSYNWLTSV